MWRFGWERERERESSDDLPFVVFLMIAFAILVGLRVWHGTNVEDLSLGPVEERFSVLIDKNFLARV